MAILRGGKRIGGFDIRLGIPRDRSLDNVNNDPRFKQKAGGNPETTIGRMQSYVNEAEGFARKARFYVEYYLPRGSGSLASNKTSPQTLKGSNYDGDLAINNINLSTSEQEALNAFPDNSQMQGIQSQNGRRVRAFCSGINMPARTLEHKDIQHHGPVFKPVFNYTTGEVTATFYADKFLRERTYFELWQSAAFSNESHNFNFYDNYVSDINIFQLGQFASRNERDDITYAIKLFECYPKVISDVDYSYDSNNLQTFTVTFAFRNWVNYFLDKSGNIDLGSPNFRDVTVKSQYGALGGILNSLPPELRRAGRDVLEGLKRRVPIGGITGGRAFPPFGNLPPLNL
jgi:hypothetical protein